MFANYASTNVITDSVRFLVVRRDMDRQLEDGTGEANFLLALPIGNRGLLNLETPEEDLSPIEDVAVSLCDKPFGLWLALSFDDPTPSSALDSPPKQRPVPPMPKRSRKSGSRAPSSSSSSGILRRDQGRQGGGAGRGQGGGGASGAGTTGRSGPRNAGKHHPVFYGSKHKVCLDISHHFSYLSTRLTVPSSHLGRDTPRTSEKRCGIVERFIIELSLTDFAAEHGSCLATLPIPSYHRRCPENKTDILCCSGWITPARPFIPPPRRNPRNARLHGSTYFSPASARRRGLRTLHKPRSRIPIFCELRQDAGTAAADHSWTRLALSS